MTRHDRILAIKISCSSGVLSRVWGATSVSDREKLSYCRSFIDEPPREFTESEENSG